MNCQEIKLKLKTKDAELKLINDKTIEIFNLIKDDCLNTVINRAIEHDFNCGGFGIHLSTFEIMNNIKDKLGLDFSGVRFECYFINGVERANLWVDSYSSDLLYRGLDEIDLEKKEAILKAIEKKLNCFNSAVDFTKTFNWSRLCTMIRSYIISNGFKGVVAKHRYTGRNCNLMSFTTTKEKLLRQSCRSNTTTEQETSKAQIFTVIFVLTILLMWFLFS